MRGSWVTATTAVDWVQVFTRNADLLGFKQCLLKGYTPSIAAQLAISAQDAMAGNQNCDPVSATGRCDCPHRAWSANVFRELAVPDYRAFGDCSQRVPHQDLKFASPDIKG